MVRKRVPEATDSKLSDHCLIDHFEEIEVLHDKITPRKLVLLPVLLLDRKMHFTGFRGGIWRALGVDRSHKNPNVCNM